NFISYYFLLGHGTRGHQQRESSKQYFLHNRESGRSKIHSFTPFIVRQRGFNKTLPGIFQLTVDSIMLIPEVGGNSFPHSYTLILLYSYTTMFSSLPLPH